MQISVWLAIRTAFLQYALLSAHYLRGQSLNILSTEHLCHKSLLVHHAHRPKQRKLYYKHTHRFCFSERFGLETGGLLSPHHPKMTVKERWNINLSLSSLTFLHPAIAFLLLYPPPPLFCLCCYFFSISFLRSPFLLCCFQVSLQLFLPTPTIVFPLRMHV